MTLLAPAHAGHWVFTVSGSGEADLNGTSQQKYQAPSASTTGTVSIPQIAAGDAVGPVFGGGTPKSLVATASLSVTVTGQWTTDTNSDNTPPPGIIFKVTSSANGNYTNDGGSKQAGRADDGFQDPFDPNASLPGTSHTLTPKYVPTKSGSFSITLSLSASATGTPGSHGGGSAGASVGPASIAIHAQPYNFRRTNFPDVPSSVVAGPGELQFHYGWNSTTGALADLTGIQIHENVDAPSTPSGTDSNGHLVYITDAPPFAWNPLVHLDSVALDGSLGRLSDDHLYGGDIDNPDPSKSFFKPYKVDSFNLTQTYKFYDPVTMLSGTEQLIPGTSGPFTIVNKVVADSHQPSGYSFLITKDGETSLPQPLP